MAATPRTPQRGNIVDAKDLRYFIRIASKNWYFVAVALVLASVMAYLYSYKLPDIYGASTQILLKDNDVYNYQTQMYKSLGYVGVYGDIVNQKRVLTSYDLINNTLDRLDFDVSYYVVGRYKRQQVHGTLPFTVSMDVLEPRLYNRPIDLQIIDEKEYSISYDKGGEIVTKVFPFDRQVRDPDNEFLLKVTLAPYVNAQTVPKVAETDYQFIRHERNSLVSQFKNRINVQNHDFTTILEVTVDDEVQTRAKMFLDTLSKMYIEYTLQSEFEINENTLTYIQREGHLLVDDPEVHELRVRITRTGIDAVILVLHHREECGFDRRGRAVIGIRTCGGESDRLPDRSDHYGFKKIGNGRLIVPFLVFVEDDVAQIPEVVDGHHDVLHVDLIAVRRDMRVVHECKIDACAVGIDRAVQVPHRNADVANSTGREFGVVRRVLVPPLSRVGIRLIRDRRVWTSPFSGLISPTDATFRPGSQNLLPGGFGPDGDIVLAFDPSGNLVPYDPGITFSAVDASGGDGLNLVEAGQIRSDVERRTAHARGIEAHLGGRED